VKGRILVVDDEASARSGLQALLKHHGYEVATAGTGEEALRLCRTFAPDLLVLDVMLPDMTGYEICRRIKQDPETRLIPVVLATALTATEDRVRGLEAGADDFLSKPLDGSELVARVRSSLKVKAYTDELERAETVIFALARSVEAKDPCTHGHCERLAEYSVALGRRLGLSEEEIVALERGGIVHDIGKVAVPDHILLKEGPLNSEEKRVMEEHPRRGEEICAPLRSFRLVLPIIRHHHEKRDGSGYPDGLRGEEIPLTARVLQIVDVYDALTTERPYRCVLPSLEALDVIRGEVASGWWDPQVYREFRAMILERGAVGHMARKQPATGRTWRLAEAV
jgi:putative two-component system response regulator